VTDYERDVLEAILNLVKVINVEGDLRDLLQDALDEPAAIFD